MVQLLDTIKVISLIFSFKYEVFPYNTSNTYKLMSSIKSRFNKNEFQNCSNEEKGESNALINGFEHYVSKIKQAIYVTNNGVEFIHFLQPSLFYKDNKYSEYEKNIIKILL